MESWQHILESVDLAPFIAAHSTAIVGVHLTPLRRLPVPTPLLCLTRTTRRMYRELLRESGILRLDVSCPSESSTMQCRLCPDVSAGECILLWDISFTLCGTTSRLSPCARLWEHSRLHPFYNVDALMEDLRALLGGPAATTTCPRDMKTLLYFMEIGFSLTEVFHWLVLPLRDALLAAFPSVAIAV